MKTALKVLAVLAAIAAVVYIIATYGERIVAWARKVMSNIFWEDCCDDEYYDEDICEDADFAG